MIDKKLGKGKKMGKGRRSKPTLYTEGSEGFDGRLDINLPEGHHLPHEIVHMILFFLPAISLTEFRCVCKAWLSAITNPTFVAAHRKRTKLSPPTTPTFVFFPQHARRFYRQFEPPELDIYDCGYGTCTKLFLKEYVKDDRAHYEYFNICTCTFNGLLLLNSSNSTYVFNPVTKDIVKLPNFPPSEHRRENYIIGFVADPTTDTYNVVRFVTKKYENQSVFRYDIHSHGSPGWRTADCNIPSVRLLSTDPVSVNGVLYWRTYGDLSILCFYLTAGDNDHFQLFRIPPHVSKSFTWFTNLEALEGNLCIVECGGGSAVTIWKLEDGGENEWSKWYSIEIQIPQLQGWGLVRVLAVYEGTLWLATKTELFSYNSRTERLVKLLESTSEEENNNSRAGGYLLGVVYTQTLASAH